MWSKRRIVVVSLVIIAGTGSGLFFVIPNLTSPRPVSSPLTSSFTFSPSSPNAKVTVTFVGLASGGNAPYGYSWSFGDGSNGTGQSITHIYVSSGAFNVTLTVNDHASVQRPATAKQIVTVRPPEVQIAYSYSSNNTCCGLPLQSGYTLLVFRLNVTDLGYPNFTADPFKDMYVVADSRNYNVSELYYIFLSDRFNSTNLYNMQSATGDVVFEVPSGSTISSPGWFLSAGEQIQFDWVDLSI